MAHERRRLYLVVVVMTVEEGLLPEDHARQHAAQAPHIQAVVVHLRHKTSVSGRVNRFGLTLIVRHHLLIYTEHKKKKITTRPAMSQQMCFQYSLKNTSIVKYTIYFWRQETHTNKWKQS